MATILPFNTRADPRRSPPSTVAGPATIIIFPGIRYENSPSAARESGPAAPDAAPGPIVPGVKA